MTPSHIIKVGARKTREHFRTHYAVSTDVQSAWGSENIASLGLSLYPDDIDTLTRWIECTDSHLKDAGWYRPDLCGKPFILWDHFGSAQLCEVDMLTPKIIKPQTGLNTDLPFGFLLARYAKDTTCVYVVANPLDALVLRQKGLSAMATYSAGVQKQQIKRIASLNKRVVLIGTENSSELTALEHSASVLAKISDCDVSIHSDLKFIHAQHTLAQHIEAHAESAISYVVSRIMSKKNGDSEHARNVALNQFAQGFNANTRAQILALGKARGAKAYPPLSEALQFLAALLDVNMSLKDAQALVTQRYGMRIHINNQGHNHEISQT